MMRGICIGIAVIGLVANAVGGELDHRWVWLTDSLVATDCVERVSGLVRKAKTCGMNGLTMGQIYADAVTKAYNIIQKVHLGAEVYIWSDMLDPNHNAVKTYYNCRGSFEDGWKWVPKDLIICCWYDRKSDLSMPFFASKGFRTLAAAYYDEKPPFKWSRQWRDVVRRTEGAIGIMYTTWRNAYGDLPAFCEMLKEQPEK